MKQLEKHFDAEIRLEICPKNIIERLKLLFCNRLLINIDLTTSSDDGFVEVDTQVVTR